MYSKKLIDDIFNSRIKSVGKDNWQLSLTMNDGSVFSGKPTESFIKSNPAESKIHLLIENGKEVKLDLKDIKEVNY